jgi:hypothetical protein
MAVSTGLWAGRPVSITNGHLQVQFDTPADFADWLAANPPEPEVLARWHWVTEPVLSDN